MMDVVILAVGKLIDEDIFVTDTDASFIIISFYIEWCRERSVSLSLLLFQHKVEVECDGIERCLVCSIIHM